MVRWSLPSDKCTSCNKDIREASSAAATVVSLFLRPWFSPTSKISQTKALGGGVKKWLGGFWLKAQAKSICLARRKYFSHWLFSSYGTYLVHPVYYIFSSSSGRWRRLPLHLYLVSSHHMFHSFGPINSTPSFCT
jgi:hypothetical protein